MARLIGPLMSEQATGTFAGQLAYRTTRRGAIAAQTPRITAEPSGRQQAVRVMTQFLGEFWRKTPIQLMPTWDVLAAKVHTSRWIAFFNYNWQRWLAGEAPSMIYPAYTSTSPAYWASLSAYRYGEGLKITATIGNASVQCRFAVAPWDARTSKVQPHALQMVTPAFDNGTITYVYPFQRPDSDRIIMRAFDRSGRWNAPALVVNDPR